MDSCLSSHQTRAAWQTHSSLSSLLVRQPSHYVVPILTRLLLTRPCSIWVRRLSVQRLWTILTRPSSFIPEFISRLPSITTLAPLSPADLRRILTDVRGSLVAQYGALFAQSGVEIKFTSPALDEICARAAERGGGARGLRGMMVGLFDLWQGIG